MKKNDLTKLIQFIGFSLIIISQTVFAETFSIPDNRNAIVGAPMLVSSAPGDTLIKIAQQYDVGLNAIAAANPDIAVTVPLNPGTRVEIPGSHVLPPLQRKGIVINLPEMRMYFYTNHGDLKTYPIGIGRVGKTIPLTQTAVIRKALNPSWIPPEDIRAFNAEQGIVLPKVMPAGPDNPLGPMAIYLKIPTYLIHSTIFPDSIGRRASFGCIRMLESDIKDFFPIITPGTPVTIVDMPNKVGWQDGNLFLESYTPLEEHNNAYYAGYQGIVNSIQSASGNKLAFVDWQEVEELSDTRDGKPHNIGFSLN